MRTALRPRAVLAAGAVPLLLLGLAACGGDEIDPTAGEPSGAATASTVATASPSDPPSEEPSEPAEEVADAAGGGSWDQATLVPAMEEAMADQKSAHVSVVTTSGGMDLTSEGDLAFRGRTQDMTLVMEGPAVGAERIEVRMVDRKVYMSMPPMTPKGKFFEIPTDDPGSPFAPMMQQMQGVDPRESFSAFEKGLRDVTFVGTEQVDGEELEQYRLTVDPRAAAKAQGLPTRQMPKSVDYDLWLDEDALMRRMELAVAGVSMVMETSGWNEPVSIKAPAPRNIVAPPGD
ncbi:MAG TPA: LppX_LprAFG lipoprotein [Nocardioidaceae bacterium]